MGTDITKHYGTIRKTIFRYTVIILVLITGAITTYHDIKIADSNIRNDMLGNCTNIASSINTISLGKLSGNLSDKNNHVYLRIKEYFQTIKSIYPEYKFIYLLGQREDNSIFFYVDSEEIGSANESAPGSEYYQAPEFYAETFHNSIPTTQGPYTDQWGSFVTCVMPVTNISTQNQPYLLGIDIDAGDWYWQLFNASIPTALLTFVIIIIIQIAFLLQDKRKTTPQYTPNRLTYTECYTIALIGILATIYFTHRAYQNESRTRQLALNDIAAHRSNVVIETFNQLHNVQLESLARFIESSEALTYDEFNHFTTHLLDISQIQAWAWAPAVVFSDKEKIQTDAQQNIKDFIIWEKNTNGKYAPVAARNVYYPVLMVAPFETNTQAVGFDLGSEPTRYRAIRDAERTRLCSSTDPIDLIQETGTQKGMLLMRPLFHKDNPESLRGVVLAAIRINSMLKTVINDTNALIELQTISVNRTAETLAQTWSQDQKPDNSIHTSSVFYAYGKCFIVKVYADANFLSLFPEKALLQSAITGLIVSSLLVCISVIITRRKSEMENTINLRTRELQESRQRLSATLRSIGDGVITCDSSGKIQGMNTAAENLTGWTFSQACNLPVEDVFQTFTIITNEKVVPPITEAINQKTTIIQDQYLNLRAKSNGVFQISSNCSPILSDNNIVSGVVLVFRDISQEYRQKEQLALREISYRNQFEMNSAIMLLIDPDTGNIIDANKSAVDFYDYSHKELLSMNFRDITDLPDDEITELLRTVSIDHGTNFETTNILADGTKRTVNASCCMINYQNKRILHIIITDITNAKEFEQALQVSESIQRTLLESIPAGIIIVDPQTRIIEKANAFVSTLFGGPIEDIVGKICHEFLCPAERDKCPVCDLGMVVDNSDRDMVRFDGSRLPILKTVKKIELNGQTKLLECFIDVSERKKTEEALSKTYNQLKMATRAGRIGIWIYKIAANTFEVDHQIYKLYGLQEDEFDGKYESWILLVHPNDRENIYNEFQMTLNGIKDFNQEFRIIWPDNSIHYLHSLAQLQTDKNTNESIVVGTSTDITHTKTVELNLKETIAQLEDTTARANQMAIEAEMSNKAKSEFLANMSHEIRTPMNGVIGMIGLLLDTNLTPEQRQFAETVRSSGESLLGLINDILDFSKIEAGKLDMEMIEFNLQDIIDEFTSNNALKAHEKGLEFICDIDCDLPEKIIGDPGRIRQILTNLTGNAIKYSDTGEIFIRVTIEQEQESSLKIKFSVKDTGIGISQDKIPTLFKSFSQIDSSTTRKYGGTGLGLAISKQLAEMMGGTIGVDSEAGVGSEFWFTVTVDKIANSNNNTTKKDIEPLNNKNILIVDNNASNRKFLATKTRAWNMNSTTAADGPEAIRIMYEALNNGKMYDIILIDMDLHGMDGKTLGSLIKADEKLQSARLIILNNFNVIGHYESLRQIGFEAIIHKPVKIRELQNVLIHTISGKPAETQIGQQRQLPDLKHTNARILLAEDNYTNQLVAIGILKQLGLSADPVANGKEAVKMLETVPYDLVIMDCQMPEMDGYEATATIRDEKSSVLNHDIPIIAMTANAMQGDMQKCLKSGMNDYIAKPVSIDKMAAMMEKLLHKIRNTKNQDQQASDTNVNIAINNTDASKAPQQKNIVWDYDNMSKRLGDDQSIIAIVLESFMESLPSQLAELNQMLDSAPIAEIARQAHSIKGASANIGGEAVRAVALQMEMAAKAEDIDTVRGLIDQLQQQSDKLIEEINQKFQKSL